MISPEVLSLAKKFGIEHLRDINHDGKIDSKDVYDTKKLMEAKANSVAEASKA